MNHIYGLLNLLLNPFFPTFILFRIGKKILLMKNGREREKKETKYHISLLEPVSQMKKLSVLVTFSMFTHKLLNLMSPSTVTPVRRRYHPQQP